MRIFTVESLRVYYIQDSDLFEEITGIDIDDYSGHDIISLTNEQIKELKKQGVFEENA
jgi:hypothetical protein